MRSLLIAACAAFSAQSAFAQETWPRLEAGAGVAACEQALALARDAFTSDSFYLYDRPTTQPPGSAIVLRVGDMGADGPDGIIADPSVFIIRPPSRRVGRLHWAARANQGQRLVVEDSPHSWRGYNYAVYAIPETMTPDAFVASQPDALSSHEWQPPVVVRDATTGALSAIIRDTYFLSPWRVFTQSERGYAEACSVQFRAEAERGDELLPGPVRLLAHRVDATLGDGRNEGTLNSTGRIRFQLSHTWANVARRPWALNARFITPRPLVDAGLRRWSRQAPSFRAAYDILLEQYPIAQAALETHYQETLDLSPEQAQVMAAYALDFALRTAYHFPGSSDARVSATSPWPADAPRGSR
jgi:hypothetical protein